MFSSGAVTCWDIGNVQGQNHHGLCHSLKVFLVEQVPTSLSNLPSQISFHGACIRYLLMMVAKADYHVGKTHSGLLHLLGIKHRVLKRAAGHSLHSSQFAICFR